MTKNNLRRDKFRRIAEERKILTANDIAWRDRLGDHEFEFWPTEVKSLVAPDWRAPDFISATHITADKEFEYVQRIYGPQCKTVQYVRTVRLDP